MNIIETKDLTKRFGAFTAVDALNISVAQGEIKAIVGENGAGKTTLMNMLFGMEQPTAGRVLLRGQEVHFRFPSDAIQAGLGMVHQHFKLVPSLSVYENILLGDEITYTLGGKERAGRKGFSLPTPFINSREEKKRIAALIEQYKFGLNPESRIADISVGLRQRVEILKMLYRDAEVLILDEPTAVLTPQEVDELLENLRQLKADGKTVILITHKLHEVMAVSDSVTVIRGGRLAGTVQTKDTNEVQLAQMMVGRDVVLTAHNDGGETTEETAYRVAHLATVNGFGKKVLDDVSFELHRGEILGVAGVEGNGQSELTRVLSGMMLATEGSVQIGGETITNLLPDALRARRIAIIPEDRFAQGLCRELSIGENAACGYFDRDGMCRRGVLNRARIRARRDRLLEEFDVRVADRDGAVSQLSGGNAQKLIIARELSSDPDVIIASQPTRGVDVGSIEYIHKRLLDARRQKKAILLISSELSEIMSLSDRVIVMYKGRVIGQVPRSGLQKEKLGLLMAGVRPDGMEG